MRRRTKYLAPPLIFLSADVAAADLSGEIGFVSDYRDRGVSQSAEAVAVQAALDLDITEAWRLSAWASSLRDNPLGDAEINLSASYAGGLGLMGFWVAGVQGALFPGGPGGDHVELYGTLGLDYGLLVPSLGVTYAPSNNDGTGANLYAQARVDAAWPGKPYGAIFSAGFDHFERARDKWDWSAGLFYQAGPLRLTVRYVDTDQTGTRRDATVVVGAKVGF